MKIVKNFTLQGSQPKNLLLEAKLENFLLLRLVTL